MILGPIRLIDLVVFALFLAPQFAFRVGVFRTVLVALRALPFIRKSPGPSSILSKILSKLRVCSHPAARPAHPPALLH
jgi:hypothetical protein